MQLLEVIMFSFIVCLLELADRIEVEKRLTGEVIDANLE